MVQPYCAADPEERKLPMCVPVCVRIGAIYGGLVAIVRGVWGGVLGLS